MTRRHLIGSMAVAAAAATGYKGFVGQEFVPKDKDKLASLRKCIQICDV